MATDHIRYDVLARDALRGVLRRVLTDAAEHGLPGEHHFFITFLSTADGVKLSPRLLAQYPEEMTIILQHQFWDLVVTEDRFEVGLSFGGIPERLVVPFAAIKSFLDPSVQFGLQFEPSEAATEAPAAKLPTVPAPSALPVAAGARRGKQGRAGKDERRRGSGSAGSFPQEIIHARENRLRCSVNVPPLHGATDMTHGSIRNIRKQIHPQRDRQLRSDRRSRRPLLGRANRTLAAEFQDRPGPHADRDRPCARHRQTRLRPNQPRTRIARCAPHRRHHPRRARGDRRQARRSLSPGGLADRLRHPDQHEPQRGDRQPRQRTARRQARRQGTGSSQRPRQHEPVVERFISDRDAHRRRGPHHRRPDSGA